MADNFQTPVGPTPSASASAAPTEERELAIADQLGRELVRFVRLIHRVKAHLAGAHKDGIERSSYALLACLVQEGPQRTTALAELVHSDPSTVSRQVSGLVQHGLVERQADPVDGRACRLAATPQGLRVFDENRRARNKQLAQLMAWWPEADRTQLVALLDRLNSDLESSAMVEKTLRTSTAKGESR
ncbi:MarR family winged helix-turn-helix transcriptional regulator [Goodfellowiella coeruleoviolacea]|uniref:DNA-binding transcriptional regulator, MarR family n=1 Tax=Goodfellowiella coeruleoviolacea TaxID=334858 RepID=A0AAE3KGS7_9PSEU|nr:MarR family transcriptional regulator [Goodfellowiella coeruleoviolacea]MCP2166207.1 DNA-binding transcriptional regulator, MarR family [Goodfellowiella coeruleoviolacea]